MSANLAIDSPEDYSSSAAEIIIGMLERPASAYGSGYALDGAAQDALSHSSACSIAVTINFYWRSI
jgi:hypothetical protein